METPRRGYKAKTIKAIISKKIGDWLESIEDISLRDRVRKNTIVTGGSIASMLLGEEVNDFDIYFRNIEITHALAKYYVDRFHPKDKRGIDCKITAELLNDRVRVVIKSAGIASEEGTEKPYRYFEAGPDIYGQSYVDDVMGPGYAGEIVTDAGDATDIYEETENKALQTEDEGLPKYRPVFMSTNAITLSNRIQLVLRFSGEPDEIHKNYDFVHCTNYWQSWDGQLVLRAEALEALLSRELRYVGSKYPLCSIIRLRKFIKRGWVVNAGQILKMVMQLQELNLKDINVLQDQLTGVDSAYFCQVIERLKEKDPEKINSAYLIEIIDRMF